MHVHSCGFYNCKASAKWWQHIDTKYRNNVGLAGASSGQTIATFQHNIQHCWAQHGARVFPPCCDMLGIENRTIAHARVQHSYTNLAKRLQHHTTYKNVAWKIWPASNLSQQHPTCRNMSQQGGQTHATCSAQQCCVNMLRSFGRGVRLPL